MLSIGPRTDAWRPPILKTVATTAEGIAGLREALDRFRVFGQSSALSVQRQQAKCRVRLLELLRTLSYEQREVTLERSAALLADLPIIRALMTSHDAPTIQDASHDLWNLSGSDR